MMKSSRCSTRGIGMRAMLGFVIVVLVQAYFLAPGVYADNPESNKHDANRERVSEFSQQNGWNLLVKETCPYCNRAREFLDSHGIRTNIWVVRNDEKSKTYRNIFFDLTNIRTVPIIFHNAKLVGGYSNLQTFYNNLESEKKSAEL